ncbi:MAG: hypothetical protein D6675_01800 [Gemmatimonadetes bacterium]|nr:MAG: hypothetical protein D6675_01800 [Gemmatimonadota bacterium]
MPPNIVTWMGWLPGIIIPTATVIQLIKIFRSHHVEGVSWFSWFLFGIANLGLYVYTEKYLEIQSLVGLLGSAVLDFVIVWLVLRKTRLLARTSLD